MTAVNNNKNRIQFWFSELINAVVEYQCDVVDEWFEHLTKFDTEREMLEIAVDCGESIAEGMADKPIQLFEQGVNYWIKTIEICQNSALRLLDKSIIVAVDDNTDNRFQDLAWTQNIGFDFIRQQYLLAAKTLLNTADQLHDPDKRRHRRLVYYTRQFVNALAPTNFPLTNPEVLRATLDSGGANIVQGLRLMLEDRKRSTQLLNVCMSQPNAFELGRDIACTPGAVVYENKLFQLIQYHPVTEQVWRTPILLVPSWINKYYILDLTPENSFVRWLVAQGHTVFVMSWVNPDQEHREASFAHYLTGGVLTAVDTIEQLTGEKQVSALGYCLGGILLACTLAYCAEHETRFASATYLASSIDFSDPGDMSMFIDEDTVDALEQRMSEEGYLDGRLLAAGFSLLRENDLFWSYYVTNYLKGERPPAHDLMHWNADNTNVPAANHSFILRELHLHNRLIQPDKIKLHGRPIDMRRIQTPTYVLATEKDHIAEWRSAYTAVKLQRGPRRFVLAGSGHIAGIINPPEAEKYNFCVNDSIPATPEKWLAGASRTNGSWWNDWQRWQMAFAGPQIPARQVDELTAIEPAPGRYVRRRLVV